jgi:putative transposase
VRSRRKSIIEKDRILLDRIKDLKTEHPLWGYRRIWSYLKYRQGLSINKKCIFRVMKENGFLVTKNFRLKAKRSKIRPKPRAMYPNEFWGIDMTKIRMRTWGWLYLTVVLDWHTKEIVGYSLSIQSKTEDWLLALNRAVMGRFPEGTHDSKRRLPYLVSDNGCQPTSTRFMKACSVMGLKQIFTSWNNPKGNSDTERVMRTIKEDLVWPYEWDNPFDFEIALDKWVGQYNSDYPHQTLNNKTPNQFYRQWLEKNTVKFTGGQLQQSEAKDSLD